MKRCIPVIIATLVILTFTIVDGVLERRKRGNAEDRLGTLCEAVGERLNVALSHVKGQVAFERVEYSLRASRMVAEIRACASPEAFNPSSYERAFQSNNYPEIENQLATAAAALGPKKQ